MILAHRRPQTVAVRVGTGPMHLARPARAGYRLACGRTVTADRCTVMHRRVWTSLAWRVCQSCLARAERAATDAELFA